MANISFFEERFVQNTAPHSTWAHFIVNWLVSFEKVNCGIETRGLKLSQIVQSVYLSTCGIAGLTVTIAAPAHRCTGLPHPMVQDIRECFVGAS